MPIKLKSSCSSIVGRREKNEDQVCHFLNLKNNGTSIKNEYAPVDLFVICDGHAGIAVSKFASDKLLKYFSNKKIKYPLKKNVVVRLFDKINNEIKSMGIGETCGSTALMLCRCFDGKKEIIQVINLGDCRAVMAKNGFAIPLTKDHKPNWPEERTRIEKIISKNKKNSEKISNHDGDWRISGLSVSRVFGDFDCLPYVSHIPDIFEYDVKDIDFVVMGCDGLYDCLQNHEIINFIYDHINGNNLIVYKNDNYPNNKVKNTKNISTRLAEYAMSVGSRDNISLFIISFMK